MKKRKKGRPVTRSMPDPIPDTPENIAAAIFATPPKKKSEWKYLRDRKDMNVTDNEKD